MPRGERDAHRAAGIARGGLDEEAAERALSQNPAVADAVQRHAAGQAEVLAPRFPVQGAGEAEHHLLGDVLDGPREVHLPLGEQRLRLAGRAAEERVELVARHREPGAVVEVVHVEPEGAVRLQVQQVVEDGPDVLGAPVGRQAHHLVLAGVDLEAQVVGEGRVEQTDRVREGDLPQRGQLAAVAEPGRRRRPLADAVHAQDGGAREGRRVERGGGVGLVVLAEEDRGKRRRRVAAGERPQLVLEKALQEHLLLEPDGHGRHEGSDAPRRERQVRLEQALQLDEGLVVEGDVAQVAEADPALAQAVARGVNREPRVVLLPREALLLGRRHDLAVAHQTRGAVVVEGGDAEDVVRHGRLAIAGESSARTLSRRHAAIAAFAAGAKWLRPSAGKRSAGRSGIKHGVMSVYGTPLSSSIVCPTLRQRGSLARARKFRSDGKYNTTGTEPSARARRAKARTISRFSASICSAAGRLGSTKSRYFETAKRWRNERSSGRHVHSSAR